MAGRARPDLATIALENRLASTDPLWLAPAAIEDLLAEYGVRLEVRPATFLGGGVLLPVGRLDAKRLIELVTARATSRAEVALPARRG